MLACRGLPPPHMMRGLPLVTGGTGSKAAPVRAAPIGHDEEHPLSFTHRSASSLVDRIGTTGGKKRR